MALLKSIIDFVIEYGGALAFLLTWTGIGWLYWRQRADWQRKQFANQVNFSLSYVLDGRLVMRTLLETSAHNVWLSELAVKKVQQAASKTTTEQPFLQLPNPTDMDFLYRAVLNVLSEKFADVYLAQTLGMPVVTKTYCFAITFERYKPQRTFKLRVLLVTEEDLESVFAPSTMDQSDSLAHNEVYAARLQTLRAMHELHRSAEQDSNALKLGRVALGLPSQ